MPSLAPHPCSGGCGRLVKRGKCEACQSKFRKQADSHRGTAQERGYTAGWARYSKAFRKRFPLCGQGPRWSDEVPSPFGCLAQDRYVAGEQTDHIIPVSQGGDFWDDRNHQSLCTSCHSRKTQRESSQSH
jgi:5-methylcytosine-specific restriction protein A